MCRFPPTCRSCSAFTGASDLTGALKQTAPRRHNYALDMLVGRFHYAPLMRVRLHFNATAERCRRRVGCVVGLLLYHRNAPPPLPTGKRGERGSPVDGDQLFGRAVLPRRGRLPPEDRREYTQSRRRTIAASYNYFSAALTFILKNISRTASVSVLFHRSVTFKVSKKSVLPAGPRRRHLMGITARKWA